MGKKAKKLSQADTAKNAANGEGDIDQLLHELDAKEGKKGLCTEEASDRPSPRVHATLTKVGHGIFMLFGGEHYDGRKIQVFHDLFKLQLQRRGDNMETKWSKLSFETGPRARSAYVPLGSWEAHKSMIECCRHQAVFYKNQIYIHGGEYTSPNLNKFHHFSDIWSLDCAGAPRWSEVVCQGKIPLARSGHRATVVGGKMFCFGGFFDNSKEVKYFNDLNSFDLTTKKWNQFVPSSSSSSSSSSTRPEAGATCQWPQARSGCGFASAGEELVLVGGFSREGGVGSSGQDDTKGIPFWDAWTVNVGGHVRGERWRCEWRRVAMGETVPPARVGFGLVEVGTVEDQSEGGGMERTLLLFGGVHDVQVEDSLESKFLNDVWSLQVGKDQECKWKQLRAFQGDDELAGVKWPQGRMSIHVCHDDGDVVIYGGKRDGGEREMTFDDVWSIRMDGLLREEGSKNAAKLVQSLSQSCSVWFDSDDEEGEEEDDEEGEEGEEEEECSEDEGGEVASKSMRTGNDPGKAPAAVHEAASAAKQTLPEATKSRKGVRVPEALLLSMCERQEPLGWRVRKEISSSSSSVLGPGWREILLRPDQILQFDRQGHFKCPELLTGEALKRFQDAVEEEIRGKMLEEVRHIMRVLGEDSEDAGIQEAALRCEDAEEGLVQLQQWCEEKCIEVPFLQGFNLHWGTSEAAAVIRALSLSEWMGKVG
eukprot:762174-Hanusia_phi.AAC.2